MIKAFVRWRSVGAERKDLTRTNPTPRGVRRRHLWIAAVVVALLLVGGFAVTRSREPEPGFCTADGLIAPNGPWGRDNLDHCLWKNPDGDLYTDEFGNVTN